MFVPFDLESSVTFSKCDTCVINLAYCAGFKV